MLGRALADAIAALKQDDGNLASETSMPPSFDFQR
jgi:hypothetical protein